MTTPSDPSITAGIRRRLADLRRLVIPDGTPRQARYHRLRVALDRWYRGPEQARERPLPAARIEDEGAMSVVVLCVEASPNLVGAVRSLADQRPRPEIIVVNSGRRSAGALLKAAGLDVVLIESRSRLLPGAARNVGVAASHGKFVAFLASDCIARPGWVAFRLASHRAGADLVATPVVNANPWNPFSAATHLLLFSTRLPGTAPGLRRLYGASYARELFARHGAFRNDLRTGEDTDFHGRIGKACSRHFEPAARTAHRNPRGPLALLRDQFARGRRSVLAYASMGAAISPAQVARNAVQRLPGLLRTALRSTPGCEWPSLLWALPWTLPGALAYALGACSAARRARTDSPAPDSSHRGLIALLQLHNDRDYLQDYLDNVGPHVDGILVLDDGSTDGGADLIASHPKVLEVLRLVAREPHKWDELRNRRLLVDAAGRHGAFWLIAVDADERLERDFRRRSDAHIRQAQTEGVSAMAVTIRELWDAPDQYRVDGVWGRKQTARLFRYRDDHDFGAMELHGVWAPVNGKLTTGGFRLADLTIYHQRMIHAADRERRRRRYVALDPDRRWQSIGYDYLTDPAGLRLERLPEGRDYLPLRAPPADRGAPAPAPVTEVEPGERIESASRVLKALS